MCIFLATTAHPSYAIVILDNRDEFILRPTSRPHWWTSQHQEILSARDLQRPEQGTWLGITKKGKFAVLTNFRESSDTQDHPVQGKKSRGGMVTAWLTSPDEESTQDFVHHLLGDEGVKGVGGFSLVCGKLRKRRESKEELEPFAIISNRSANPDDVPWIAGKRGEVYGLSNTSYSDPEIWPKVKMGKEKLLNAVDTAMKGDLGEEEFVDELYAILDTNTLPEQGDEDFETYLYQLRKSIFIPSIGKAEPLREVLKADQISSSKPLNSKAVLNRDSEEVLKNEESPDAETRGAMMGIYGTQRQTVVLVDWDGHVTVRERPLYDKHGNPIERGVGDMKFEFDIQGWNEDKTT